MHNYRMYIIAIGWLWVALMMTITAPNILSGASTLLFIGILPCALIIYLGGAKMRRQRREFRESLTNQRAGDDNRRNTQSDE
jgi:hypothetical protein